MPSPDFKYWAFMHNKITQVADILADTNEYRAHNIKPKGSVAFERKLISIQEKLQQLEETARLNKYDAEK